MTLDWLLEHGGPVIRYRTATELAGSTANLDTLEGELLQSPVLHMWLQRFMRDTSFNAVHGAKHTTYESVMGKLTQLGCRYGMTAFDDKTRYFREWLPRETGMFSDVFYTRTIVAAFLLRAGYTEDPAVREIARQRLHVLADFCAQGNHDFYVDPASYPAIPKAYRDQPLVDPDLFADGNMPLPTWYDLYILANYPSDMLTPAVQQQINTVMDYILEPAYQRLPNGYGIALFEPRRYWVIGWSVHLPGLFYFDLDDAQRRSLLRHLLLLVHFPSVQTHQWFQTALDHLETFKTAQGTYLLPREYLIENATGYWILGNYMGLEANRRTPQAIELESTFWMLKLKQMIG